MPTLFRSKIEERRVIAIALLATVLILLAGYAFYLKITPVYPRRDIVGVIRIEGYIEEPSVVKRYLDVIGQAIFNDSIKAVVVVIDSGGGYADYIEQIYLDLLVLKERKPLVASVVSALSGGYYIAVSADHIFVHPTSMVGNVGVKASMPPILVPSEVSIETGAYKWTGFSQLLFPFNLSRALDNFLSAIERNRGDKLKIPQDHLKRALIYLGIEALELGLVDEVGSLQSAIKMAAQRANLTRYEVVEIKPGTTQDSLFQTEFRNYTLMNASMLTMDMLNVLHPPPAIHYIYLPPEAILSSSQFAFSTQFNATLSTSGGNVVIDVSHGNQVSWWVLDKLIFELAKMNVSVSFAYSWSDASSRLGNASALIVASPTIPYSAGEVDAIKKFVGKGGLLLLFFDPAWEYIGLEGLRSEIIAPINSLSTGFGLSLAKGYLYNEAEYFGIYRNIYIRNFGNHALTQGLNSLVLFTAAGIYSADKGIAWTSSETYSSVAERADEYAVVAAARWGNGTVIAVGDLTFLMEPYCYVEDNYKFLVNIASLIANVSIQIPEKEEAVEGKITRPDLPVGTEKIFREQVDGNEFTFRWLKNSEREIIIERANQTIHYYLTEDGALEKWVSDGRECVYEEPIPEPPYPLTRDKSWSHRGNFTLTVEGTVYYGEIIEENHVKTFENIVAEDGNTYFCAKIEYNREEITLVDEVLMKVNVTGNYWIASEAGTVKQEFLIRYYMDDVFVGLERDVMILISIRK
ncbi:S49 family peptidase [Candidatus Bathyarchaeota archaeon]|nr:S49 family peptidase [Candidatus Bathyarchaeota archaeon]